MFRCIKNHRSDRADLVPDPYNFKGESPALNKEELRVWQGKADTNHLFYCLSEGVNPNIRIKVDNPVARISGFIGDYDVPAYDDFEERLKANSKLVLMPTYSHKTRSGNFRLIWLFSEPLVISDDYVKPFLAEFARLINAPALSAGFDKCSLSPSQYYEVGYDWKHTGDFVPPDLITSALFHTTAKKTIGTDINVPIEAVEEECLRRWSSRLPTGLKIGQRVPLFWIDDGVDREGGQVGDHGIICFSDRAGKGFVSWSEILGGAFVSAFEQKKVSGAVTDVWYDGKRYYRFTNNGLFDFPKEDLTMELRSMGLAAEKKKGQRVSEVEQALLYIQAHNRIHGSAPILHEKDRVVRVNGSIVLNSNRNKCVVPAETGEEKDFPFLSGFFRNFLDDPDDSKPADYLFAWMKRAYESLHHGHLFQGQAVILVGPTGMGKTLFSNKILAGLLGGAATASDYLQARTQFNKELAENPVWSIDDTASATNAADHRKFTELLKARIANPMIDVMAKYQDSVRIPWAGRIIISLNEDVQSLAVVPSLDVSNADKLLGFRVSTKHKPKFPPNHELEKIISDELPYFARFLLDWDIPEQIVGDARFGVGHYMHPFIMNAARDNGSRAPAIEAIEMFARVHRDATGSKEWKGTATMLRSLFNDYADLSGLSFSRDQYALARGLASAEEAFNTGMPNARPVTSESRGKGKRYTINLDEKYDDEED